MAETTKIKLSHKKEVREFDVTHAERLLQLQAKNKLSDWAIAPDQPFEFKNGVISPTGKGKDKDTSQ
jgi:hypothetical protein